MEFEVRRRKLIKEDVLAELKALEERYGVPTERFDEAFRDEEGVLHETPDFLHWCFIKAIYERIL